jgi:cytochrome c
MPISGMRGTVAPALVVAWAILAATPVQAADPARGKSVFAAQCAMCHTANKGGPPILGPNLYGVVGRKAGSVGGYNYSPAMKASGLVWSESELEIYLSAPRANVPGTRMTYGGLKDAGKLADLIGYLDVQK